MLEIKRADWFYKKANKKIIIEEIGDFIKRIGIENIISITDTPISIGSGCGHCWRYSVVIWYKSESGK